MVPPRAKDNQHESKSVMQRRKLIPRKRAQGREKEKAAKRQFLGMFVAAGANQTCNTLQKGQQSSPTLNDERPLNEGGTSSTAIQTVQTHAESTPLPKFKERQEGLVYSYHYQGKDQLVGFQGRYLYCTCVEGGVCGGGRRLEKCRSLKDSTSTSEVGCTPLGQREHVRSNYVGMNSGKSFSAAPSRELSYGEKDMMNTTSIPSNGHSSGVSVIDNGRWGPELMAHEAWSISTHGLTFPLRVGARWRKQFRGRHADVVGLSQVNIIFEIALNSDVPENRPAVACVAWCTSFSDQPGFAGLLHLGGATTLRPGNAPQKAKVCGKHATVDRSIPPPKTVTAADATSAQPPPAHPLARWVCKTTAAGCQILLASRWAMWIQTRRRPLVCEEGRGANRRS